MGLLVSTDLTWTPFERSAGRVWFFESSIINSLLLVGPVGMWAKASISPLFELARETGEAEPVGAADRPHTHRLCGDRDHPRGARHRARTFALHTCIR